MSTEILKLPTSTEEFLADLPEDVDKCIDLIASSFFDAASYSTLRFWHIGRIIETLRGRDVKNVVEKVMKRTGYQKRTVQYTIAFYNKFPEFDFVKQICEKGIEWSDFKEMLRIKKEPDRKDVMKQLLTGSIKKDQIKDKVDELVKKDTPPPPKKTTPKAKKEDSSPNPAKYFNDLDLHLVRVIDEFQTELIPLEDHLELKEDDRFDDASWQQTVNIIMHCIANASKLSQILIDCASTCTNDLDESSE